MAQYQHAEIVPFQLFSISSIFSFRLAPSATLSGVSIATGLRRSVKRALPYAAHSWVIVALAVRRCSKIVFLVYSFRTLALSDLNSEPSESIVQIAFLYIVYGLSFMATFRTARIFAESTRMLIANGSNFKLYQFDLNGASLSRLSGD